MIRSMPVSYLYIFVNNWQKLLIEKTVHVLPEIFQIKGPVYYILHTKIVAQFCHSTLNAQLLSLSTVNLYISRIFHSLDDHSRQSFICA